MARLNRHTALNALNDRISIERPGGAEWQRRTEPNKRFDPTGISLALIVNLSVVQVSSGESIAALVAYT
jgi:hypothetical protein